MEKSPIQHSVQIVAINNEVDLRCIQGSCEEGAFYKFPIKGIGYPKKECDYIAFYLTDNDKFGKDKKGIIYYAKIEKYSEPMKRKDICKDEKFLKQQPELNDEEYYKLSISKLERL